MTPKLRQTVYYLGTIASAIVGLSLLWGALTADQAAALTGRIEGVVGGVITLLGGGATATAARTVGQQIKAGMFDAPPAVTAVQAMQAIGDEYRRVTEQVATGLARLQEAAAVVPAASVQPQAPVDVPPAVAELIAAVGRHGVDQRAPGA